MQIHEDYDWKETWESKHSRKADSDGLISPNMKKKLVHTQPFV